MGTLKVLWKSLLLKWLRKETVRVGLGRLRVRGCGPRSPEPKPFGQANLVALGPEIAQTNPPGVYKPPAVPSGAALAGGTLPRQRARGEIFKLSLDATAVAVRDCFDMLHILDLTSRPSWYPACPLLSVVAQARAARKGRGRPPDSDIRRCKVDHASGRFGSDCRSPSPSPGPGPAARQAALTRSGRTMETRKN